MLLKSPYSTPLVLRVSLKARMSVNTFIPLHYATMTALAVWGMVLVTHHLRFRGEYMVEENSWTQWVISSRVISIMEWNSFRWGTRVRNPGKFILAFMLVCPLGGAILYMSFR